MSLFMVLTDCRSVFYNAVTQRIWIVLDRCFSFMFVALRHWSSSLSEVSALLIITRIGAAESKSFKSYFLESLSKSQK